MTTKMNLPGLLLFFAVVLFSIPSCDILGVRGTGELETEIRNVDNFHALEINVPGDVEVRTDSIFYVEVTCEDNLIAYLETVEDNGVLKIYFDRDVYDVDDLKIRVSAPSWDGFKINGSADVDVPDAISGNKLDVGVSGSGNLKVFNLDFNNIVTRVSGSGDVFLAGTADDLKCTVSGSGNVNALGCPVKTATVAVSGSGDVRLHVTETLDVTISGSGDVEYEGAPQVTKQISGSGNVRKL